MSDDTAQKSEPSTPSTSSVVVARPSIGSPEWVAQQLSNAARSEHAKIYQLGLWNEEQRALPTDFIACALFSAVQAKAAPYLRGEQIACVNGYKFTFTGKRLTQVHADVLMGAAHLARGEAEGFIARFRARPFLRMIGRSTGGSQRRSLQQLVDDVMATSLRVTDPDGKASFSGPLLARAADVQNGDDAEFAVEISRELCKAFTRGFAKVNFEQRKALMKQPLALWLQLYVTKFHRPVPVQELRRLSGSTTRRLTDFRTQLRIALDVLRKQGVIAAWHIDSENDVLFYAPPGKHLPGGRDSQSRQAVMEDAAAETTPQLSLLAPVVSPRTLQIVAARHAELDVARCYADWQKWVSEKGITLKKPDAHFLDFCSKWGT